MNTYVLVAAAFLALTLPAGSREAAGEAQKGEGDHGKESAAQEKEASPVALCDASNCLVSTQTMQNMMTVIERQAEEIHRMRQFGCGLKPS